MPDFFRKNPAVFSPQGPVGRGKVVHRQALGGDPYAGKQGLDPVDPFFGFDISLQEMTLALQSTGDEHAVNSPLKGPQDVNVIQLAGAQQADDFNVGRI